MERVRYLEPQEKQKTRGMYEQIFSEDTKEFVDYYYKWKTKDNRILVLEEAGIPEVMMHLNPYTLWIHGHLRKVPYIVAVATHQDCRRQGKMGRVMEWALQDLAQQQAPFTFLLPADPAYYRGQGFVFFPCQNLQESFLGKGTEKKLFPDLQWQKAEAVDIPEMVEFSNNILQEKYHIFVKRDAQYYQRLFAETKAERGGVLLLKEMSAKEPRCARGEEESRLKGILVYGAEQQKAEIQELLIEAQDSGYKTKLCRDALPELEITFGEFPMMVRIANLREFVSLMKSEKACCYEIKVKDEMVPSNCGCFRIEVSKDGGRIQEISQEKVKEEIDIQKLAEMLLEDTCVYLKEWV